MSMNTTSPHRPQSSSSSRHSPRREASSRPGTAASRPLHGHTSTDEQSTVALPSHDGAREAVEGSKVDGRADAAQEQLESHSRFQPFFTLIEDAHTSDYHHPTVHYIFSDDDTDIVTEAALRSLQSQQDTIPDSQKDPAVNPIEAGESLDPSKTTLLPPPIPGVRENYLILDVGPVPPENPQIPPAADPSTTITGGGGGAGGAPKSMSSSPANPPALPSQPTPHGQSTPSTQFRVTSAQSFSPTWQVLHSELIPAPTFENSNPGESPGHGLMLKVHGTAGLPAEIPGKDRGNRGPQRLEEMMDQFAKRMGELQQIIDAADTTEHSGTEPPREQEAGEQRPTTTATDSDDETRKEGNSAQQGHGDLEHS
ncbi:hypothetical protein NUU61_005778 [Penicillium alfredii]|uniref:Uncharacterized protein n=1 Tax=Penicillium alfredii TaxID=1506179 RepID=A0A9W9K8Z3_9EURO|nr:uncharacterized protein NUU61_005778 [Penicillium alfredii]KAJ5096422.1 hypothetical protein NUU61_005778 [Penicillium alfredii]